MKPEQNIPLILPAEPFRPESPRIVTMANGVKLYAFERGEQDIVKVDVVIKAGTVFQPRPLVAMLTGKLLREGTASYNSGHISYQLDFHGAYLEFSNGYHFSTLSLICLTRHLPKLMPLLASVVREPVFPEKEFRVILENRKQEYLVNEQKVKMQAAKAFNKQLWGDTHPYAQHAEESDFDALTTTPLKAFYKKAYTPANCTLFVAGKVSNDVIAIIDKYLCVGWEGGLPMADMVCNAGPIANKRTFMEKDGVQSAIRMGCHVIGKGHSDFPAFQVLNTVLGGYFGSRLMRNIREDKGYTYGIGSYIASQPLGSYLAISTETDNGARENVISEIYKELNALHNEPVGEDELQMVKNYMSGELMRSFDGPFAIIDVYRSLWEMNLNFDYFKEYLEAIEATTPQSLQELARAWLNPNNFYIAMAGKSAK